MDDGEIGECVNTLIRLHGAHAAKYLIQQLDLAADETGRRNWVAIAGRYADVHERVLEAFMATAFEEAAKHRALGGEIH
ncbi:hypothetical protein [Sphingomonas sp. Y38-1Y]|uniref:hypothetical protein n=1 Tax=Sphingomonas sp. Y38-1Y TaxID=3078265 RepID=UPI0028E59078|nr:hypothetical protein [Sphingomonas sp. Y38-1Y]